MTYGYIYKISFPNNKIYIGLTTTSIEQRHKEHKSCALGGSTLLLYKALRKNDMIETFELEQIDTADTLEELCEKEEEYIKQYNSHYIEGHGYNMTYGGEGVSGYIYTEEQKLAISERQKKRFENPDAIEKNRQAQLTYYRENPDAREKNRQAQIQYHIDNPEAKEKMGKARIQYYIDHPEARLKASESQKKYHEENPHLRQIISNRQKEFYNKNPDSREKAREKTKKQFETPDARLKASETMKTYYKENPDAREKNRQAQIQYHIDNPEAKEKTSKAMIQYYIDHPDAKLKASEIKKRFFQENPEAIERMKEYYNENPEAREKAKETRKKYIEENPDYIYKVLDIKGKNKPFDVFKLDGTFIKTFNYQMDAHEYIKSNYDVDCKNISSVLSGKRKSVKGFVFKYKEIENI